MKNLKLKMARMEKGISQIDLAKRIGVTRQTIGMIESGDYNPSLKLCIAICRELGKTLDDLFWEDQAVKKYLDERQEQIVNHIGSCAFLVMFIICAISIIVQMIFLGEEQDILMIVLWGRLISCLVFRIGQRSQAFILTWDIIFRNVYEKVGDYYLRVGVGDGVSA